MATSQKNTNCESNYPIQSATHEKENNAALKIQHIWFNYMWLKDLKKHYEDEPYEPYDNYHCHGPYSENYSRCFGSCCN